MNPSRCSQSMLGPIGGTKASQNHHHQRKWVAPSAVQGWQRTHFILTCKIVLSLLIWSWRSTEYFWKSCGGMEEFSSVFRWLSSCLEIVKQKISIRIVSREAAPRKFFFRERITDPRWCNGVSWPSALHRLLCLSSRWCASSPQIEKFRALITDNYACF